jgi:N-acetylmuramate 1-kinase
MIPHSEFRIPKYDDLIRFAREALGLSQSMPIELSPLEGRGSDRTFFRLRWNQKNSAILIYYDPKRIENMYYADIAVFLRDIHVSVPRTIRHDPARSLIVMEDLGDTDLWSFRSTPWQTRRGLYQKTLTIAHKLHSFPEKDFPSDRVRLMESFGSDLYRWERDYFRNHFVRDVCGIELKPQFERELEAELSSLAERLLGSIRCLVHRDLQSQNVMIRQEEPFLIDFQGTRFGSPFYDLGSLLCDPYFEFSSDQRMDLLLYYYNLPKQDLSWEGFQKTFWEASAQRLMQALGAYGFLGLKKGLKAYLEHIPSGLLNLRLATSHVSTLPRLRELSLKCQPAIEEKGYNRKL